MKNEHIKQLENDDKIINGAIISRKDITARMKSLTGRFFNYILEQNGEIIYIGYSASVFIRLNDHKQLKSFDKITLLEFEDKVTAKEYEKSLIKFFKPVSNSQYLN